MTTEVSEVAFLATEPSEEDTKAFAKIDELLSYPRSVFLGNHWTNDRSNGNVVSYFVVRLRAHGVASSFRTDRAYIPLAERTPNSVPSPDR